MLYVHNPCVLYEVAIRLDLEVCVLFLLGWPTSQRPRATFLTVLQQRATSYTWAHMNVNSSLPHSHMTYFCLATFICKYHTPPTWQWQNFTRHLLLCMLFSGTSGNGVYNYARAARNWAKSCMWLTSHGLAIPVLFYCIQCQHKMKMNSNLHSIWMHLDLLSVNCKLCFWSVKFERWCWSSCWFFRYFYLGLFEHEKNFAFFCHKWQILNVVLN